MRFAFGAKGTLIVPVENQVRELDAKLLLACVAVERGYDVVLGSRTFVNFAMPALPRGIFLAKSLRGLSRLMLGFVRDLGHRVVAWDEESLVRFDAPTEYYAWRYSADTFACVDRLFAWGEDDAACFAAYPRRGAVPIDVTGNPRIDLLRADLRDYFAPQAAALRERYGEFILVNTNFSFVNNFVPALNLLAGAGDGITVSRTGRGMSLDFARGMHGHQAAIHAAFRELLPRLAGWFPRHRVILRPHPSEDHAAWRALCASQPNLEVIHEGNAVPWLMAAAVLLHNGCTTAVEASVLGRAVVAYQPVRAAPYDYHLPNGLSHPAENAAAVREYLGEILAGRLGGVDEARRAALFARHLSATDGPLAAERVMDVLDGATPPPPPLRRRLRGWWGCHLRTLVKRANRHRRHHRNGRAYHDHRFPGTSAGELAARVERLSVLLGRFADVRVTPLSHHLFHLSSARTRSTTA